MNVSGIVCEYNPFHNGHLYQIQQTRKFGADAIVAVMSGDFVQRGDVALLDKHRRAALALASGVDLVIELPVIWSLAPAEQFAAGAIAILNGLQVVTHLSFGCECADLNLLQTAVTACTNAKNSPELEPLLRRGMSYPAAVQHLVEQSAGTEVATLLRQPNNTLAIAYLEAIQAQNCHIQSMPIQRIGAAHDSIHTPSAPDDSPIYASASQVRSAVTAGASIAHMVPDCTAQAITEAIHSGTIGAFDQLERILLYRLRTLQSPEELADLAEIGGQGLAERIFQQRYVPSVEAFLNAVKTKRYPMARLRRILLHMLLHITQNDIQQLPPYGRILALNDTGRQLLRQSKQSRILPYSESLHRLSQEHPFAARCAQLENNAGDLYQLACTAIGTGGTEFRRKITITHSA